MRRKPHKTLCIGCRDDFYNGKNPMGIKECWMFKAARIVTRFQLSINTPMDQKSGYHKVRGHSCYHQDGYVFLGRIPDYAK